MSKKRLAARRVNSFVILDFMALMLGLALATSASAGDLRAYFDRKSVYEGDTVTLVIETTGGTLDQPDLSVLGSDFDVLGTSQSTNISILNGRRTDTIRLLVSLAPRRTGTIEVPPIQVGSEDTDSLTLQVSEAPENGSASAGDDVFVELELGGNSAALMVQQQVPLTVRLFTAVPLLNGKLEDPRAEGALVTKLGEDRRFDTRRNGRQYQVIERRYSLAPERSGELRISPVRFQGSLRTEKGRLGGFRSSLFDDPLFDRFFQHGPLSGDPFSMLERGQPVSARSGGITLDVKARPDGYAGQDWLPAQELQILDSWAESPPQLRVGEPVTRTLTLQAKGLSGPQIPEIEIPAMPDLRVYPEQSSSESRSDGETVYGISRQGVTLIPTRAGDLAIPEIRVAWWDTVGQRERIATVPGWTLKVEGESGAGAVPEPLTQSGEHRVQEPQKEAADRIRTGATQPANTPSGLPGIDRPYLIAGVLASALLLTAAGVWGLRRRGSGSRSGPERKIGVTDQEGARLLGPKARKALRLACEANDPQAAAKALLDWAQTRWQQDAPRDLGTLAERLGGGAEDLRELERRLYAPQPGHWDGAALWRAVQGGLLDLPARERSNPELLGPLYPRRV